MTTEPIPHPFMFRYDDDGTWGVQYPGDRYPITVCNTKEEAEAMIAECIRVAALEVDDDADFPSAAAKGELSP